jgi:hypothetical protein
MQGWIKLHRTWLESETIQLLNAEQQAITLQILLRANHKDGKWFDANRSLEVEVKRGQLITSRSKIANKWFGKDKSITEQKVRTTLKKLEKLGFLTIESTKTYTLINVVNYRVWQVEEEDTNQVDNQEATKKQPSINQEATTNKNVKNVKNDKEGEIDARIDSLETLQERERILETEFIQIRNRGIHLYQKDYLAITRVAKIDKPIEELLDLMRDTVRRKNAETPHDTVRGFGYVEKVINSKLAKPSVQEITRKPRNSIEALEAYRQKRQRERELAQQGSETG